MSLAEYAARARARRCRCPPESVEPRSPTWVLHGSVFAYRWM